MDASYLTTQVATIIAQLHSLFDEIGVPNHERESRETELFSALSHTLHNHLEQVAAEKDDMIREAQHIIKTIRQMEISLDDTKSHNDYTAEGRDLKVFQPLTKCLQTLKEKHAMMSKIHRERFEQVKKLVEALSSYASHFEPSFIKIALPPTSPNAPIPPTFDLSPRYVTALDAEFTRVYEEYTRRVSVVRSTAEEVVKLWAELGTPQAQTDSTIVKRYKESPEQLGLHEDDLKRLMGKRDKLIEEKCGRERRLKELKAMVEGLWDRLGVEERDRKQFLNSNRGCGMRVINEFEDELARLNELKRQNLHLFVEDARYKLQELWDGLYFSEEEMLEFTPAFSDVYSDALLSSHESEIARLEALKEQRAPILQLIDKHRSLIKDRNDLAASSQDASRLMARGQKGERRDPTRLLREEKMRKRITKELPRVEADLRKVLEDWEDEYGRPFCVLGERYLDEISETTSRAPPPRSKTPSITPASFASSRSMPPSQRGASVLRGPPPSRSSTKTPTGTIRRNPVASSASAMGARSPSKIPARVPLSNMPHGNNSPERGGAGNTKNDASSTRSMGPPTMAPPPKMRSLYAPPPRAPALASSHEMDHTRCPSAASSVGSVRNVSPEDVYDDKTPQPYMQSSTYSQRSIHAVNHLGSSTSSGYQCDHREAYAHTMGSRQPSTTSSATNAMSGSENWETYDDASEPEPDASEAYYAKLRAARGKRFTPDDGLGTPRTVQAKKAKGIRGIGGATETVIEGEGGRMIAVSGSDAGWTDEDAF